jgi:hypothetical protein
MEAENTFRLSDVNWGILNRITSPSLFGVIPTSELTMAFSIAFKLKINISNQELTEDYSSYKIPYHTFNQNQNYFSHVIEKSLGWDCMQYYLLLLLSNLNQWLVYTIQWREKEVVQIITSMPHIKKNTSIYNKFE